MTQAEQLARLDESVVDLKEEVKLLRSKINNGISDRLARIETSVKILIPVIGAAGSVVGGLVVGLVLTYVKG